MALEKYQRTAPRRLFGLNKKATAQVLLSAHANPEALPDPVSNGLRSSLAFTGKMKAAVLMTTMEPLTAIISTFKHFPDFLSC